jgi:hypothetical protein
LIGLDDFMTDSDFSRQSCREREFAGWECWRDCRNAERTASELLVGDFQHEGAIDSAREGHEDGAHVSKVVAKFLEFAV